LDVDGRLPAGASNITNTHRQKHRVVANIPRVSSYLGQEMRDLFCASEGNVLVGYDAAGLEARVEAHWCYKYTGGVAYAHELLDGDTHSNNAKLFFGEDIPTEDGKVIGKYRNPSKNGKYALTYGCTAARLADTINVPQGKATELFDSFWANNTALAGLRDSLTRHWEQRDRLSIACKLTGHTLLSRSKHSLVNLLFQHTGAIIMDLSLALMDMWLGGIKYDVRGLPMYVYKGQEVRRVIYYHDEAAWECHDSISGEILDLGIKSIIEAGKRLELNVPLDADGSVGHSWKDIH
jgi:DNA polymerase I-like protein with 3'-5' exonuclease and polymerase domains